MLGGLTQPNGKPVLMESRKELKRYTGAESTQAVKKTQVIHRQNCLLEKQMQFDNDQEEEKKMP